MRSPLALCLCPWLLLLAGCQSVSRVDLLEHELRQCEFELDEANAMLEDCHGELATAYQQIDHLNGELAGAGRRSDAPSTAPRRGLFGRPRREVPETPEITPPDGEPSRPDVSMPDQSLRQHRPTVHPATAQARPARPPLAADRRIADRRVAKLTFARERSGGLEADGQPGWDGIVLAVQPRNALGQAVRTAGAMTIELVDPALGGERGLVAAWTFSPEQAAERFRDASSGSAGSVLLFELPWPGAPPINRDFNVSVRLTTAAGRDIRADMPLRLAAQPAAAPQPAPSDVPRLLPASSLDAATPMSAPRSDSAMARRRPQWKPYR